MIERQMQSRPYLPPDEVCAHVPEEFPLVFLGGGGRYCVLATEYSRVAPETMFERFVQQTKTTPFADLPFLTGYIGALSYDSRVKHWLGEEGAPDIVYRIYGALCFDRITGKLWHVREPSDGHRPQFQLDVDRLLHKTEQQGKLSRQDYPEVQLLPLATDQNYLRRVRCALADIKQGRYYQINLLRYFHGNPAPTRRGWLRRMGALGGPYSGMIETGKVRIVSFSPERFLALTPSSWGVQIKAAPIKGTMGRDSDPAVDRHLRRRLTASPKDRAELSMIVDLMRNDLHSVCEPQTVKVTDPGSVRSYATVHHLEAKIRGRLRNGLTMGELLQSVCPGGSITGAPKKEVVQAIRQYEGRQRGYFMGHFFAWDQAGQFNSSILIRTAVHERNLPYVTYGAGSGIVIHSSPEQEMAEVSTKCRVITEAGYSSTGDFENRLMSVQTGAP